MSERKTLTREELYERVWKEPMTKLAKEFGLSDRGLAKICERNGIPVPPRGSWARKTAGQQVKRPPLLAIKGSGDQTIVISAHWPPRGVADATSATLEAADPFRTLMERELQDAKPLLVPETLRSPHRIVERWLKDAEDDAKRWRASGINLGGGTRYGSPLEKRRLRILSALFRALEGRGFVLEPNKYRLTEISARFGQDTVQFTLTERIRQQRRRLTEAEKTARSYESQEWTQTREATNELLFKIKYPARCLPASWADQPEKPLEQQLHSVLVGFVVTAAYLDHQRKVRQEQEQQRWKAEREAYRLSEERKTEAARKATLRLHARSWDRARALRAYIRAVRAAIGAGSITAPSEESEAWLGWADKHADSLDPICSGRALALTRLDIDEDGRTPEKPQYGHYF
jgi:hypothetical protein